MNITELREKIRKSYTNFSPDQNIQFALGVGALSSSQEIALQLIEDLCIKYFGCSYKISFSSERGKFVLPSI
jgi:hypothetical protein